MDEFDRALKSGEAILFRILQIITGAWMGALVCIVLYSVFCRYVLNASLAWAEELSRFLMINMVCCAAVSAYLKNEHLGLDILVRNLSSKVQFIVWILRQALMLFATAFLTFGGFQLMYNSFDMLSSALRIRMGLVYVVLPFFGGLLFIITMLRTIQKIMHLCHGREEALW